MNKRARIMIDDTEYRIVDRPVREGDLILSTTRIGQYEPGEVFEVAEELGTPCGGALCIKTTCGILLIEDECVVIEPVESGNSPKTVDDVVANLVGRLLKLEKKLDELDEKIEMCIDDIAMLDERTWAKGGCVCERCR